MIKFLSLFIIVFIFNGCTNTKLINNEHQTFIEYVIFNSNSTYETGNWKAQPSENFPLNRLENWYKGGI